MRENDNDDSLNKDIEDISQHLEEEVRKVLGEDKESPTEKGPRTAGVLRAAPPQANVRLAKNIAEVLKTPLSNQIRPENAELEDASRDTESVAAGAGKAAASIGDGAESEANAGEIREPDKGDGEGESCTAPECTEADSDAAGEPGQESEKSGEENVIGKAGQSGEKELSEESEKSENAVGPDISEKSGNAVGSDISEKSENAVGPDISEKSENPDELDISGKPDGSEKPDRSGKADAADSEKADKSDRQDIPGKSPARKAASVGASVERKEIGRSRRAGMQDKEDKDEGYKPVSDPESRRRRLRIMGIIALMLLAAGTIYYLFRVNGYKTTYLPGTYINGINAQGKTPQEIKDIIRTQTYDYSLRIKARSREDEWLDAAAVGLEYVTGDVPETILSYQNPFRWIEGYFTQTDYKVSTMTQLDEEKFARAVAELSCFDDETAIQPEDAYVSEYIKTKGYEVIPEIEGNVLTDKDQAVHIIRDAMLTMDESVNLSDTPELYKQPKRRSDDSMLVSRVTKLNKYMTITITYLYSDLEITGDQIDEWLTVESDGTLTFDDELIRKFVTDEVAAQYDTLYLPKELETSWGPTVSVTGGSYGWQVNQSEEAEQIKTDIAAAQSLEREPIYSKTAASHGEHDYGDTYVEINLTAQHLYYYKNGELVVDSDFVSGLASNSKRVTPVGVYTLTYKQTDRILRGQRRADGSYEYESHVNFWMPFNGGIGMHDASWRSSFGGNIYKTNGSHGCINMPYAAAKKLYNEIEKGCPVLCYKLEGSSGANTYVDPDEPLQTQTKPQTQTTAAATKPTATKPVTSAAQPQTVAPVPQTGVPQTVAPSAQPVTTQPAATQPAATATPVEGIGGGPGVTGSTQPQTGESVKEGISGGPGT